MIKSGAIQIKAIFVTVLLLTLFSSITTSTTHAASIFPARTRYEIELTPLDSTLDTEEDGMTIYLPLIVVPTITNLYVENDTGGTLCYEIYNTNIGQKCFGVGEHLYGNFPSGTYTYHATAVCGSLTETIDYPMGDYFHTFWCEARTSLGDILD